MKEIDKARLALLPVLAERSPSGHIGRTALMKYMYFLQALRKLPLGYCFSMYSYGPFDSDVLADLDSAETLKIVETTPVEFVGGYGYRITPGPRAATAKDNASQFLKDHAQDLDWLFSIFGNLNSAELELASTIIYVDQEFVKRDHRAYIPEVIARVHDIKPHFTSEHIRRLLDQLAEKGVSLSAVKRLTRAC